jgi:transcriptional regulator with XRE-family HTH domain
MLTFSEWLAERMRVAGFNCVLLAAELGCTDMTIGDWLRGKYLPASPKLPHLARALGVDVALVRHLVVAARAAAAAPCPPEPAAPEVRS